MPDPYFVTKKRKRASVSRSPAGPSKKPRNAKSKPVQQTGTAKKSRGQDEELDDEDSEDGFGEDLDLRPSSESDAGDSGEEYVDETAAEKRLRLAQLYLDSVREDLADGEFSAADIDKEIISSRLKQEVLEHSGKVHLFVADSYSFDRTSTSTLKCRGHRFSLTSLAVSEMDMSLYTSGKEGSIIKWDLRTGKRLSITYKVRPTSTAKGKGKILPGDPVHGHSDEVLALAVSGDGAYLVSAGRDRKVVVWDAKTLTYVREFSGAFGHKDAISGLSFRKGTNQLYTASFDRSLKVYDLSSSVMGYVETLFGHQDQILSLDALRGETCVSVGGRDKTARYWKIADETQLVFRGGGRSRIREVMEGGLRGEEEETSLRHEKEKKFIEGSLECICMVDESTFLSGGDSGSICLWNTQKKKPIFTQPLSHGLSETLSSTEGLIQTPRWVTALASLRYSDLFASGSWDGHIRMWKLDSTMKSFQLVGTIPALGVANALHFVQPSKTFWETAPWTKTKPSEPQSDSKLRQLRPIMLVAAIGQEHRFGRWLSIKDGAQNCTLSIVIHPRTS